MYATSSTVRVTTPASQPASARTTQMRTNRLYIHTPGRWLVLFRLTPKGQLRALPAPFQLNCDTSCHQHLHTDRSARQLHPTLDHQIVVADWDWRLHVYGSSTE